MYTLHIRDHLIAEIAIDVAQNAHFGAFCANLLFVLSQDRMMTPAQCRAARALLNLSQKELAISSGVSLRSVQGFETGERELQSMALKMIARILEENGVVFITEPTKIGVVMTRPS